MRIKKMLKIKRNKKKKRNLKLEEKRETIMK